ncbi:MAG TPA: ABC transporter permease subunit [Methylomirabilota bacterium]|nr:ABC transporter permease subunit [Methylomirabilota bacterium]
MADAAIQASGPRDAPARPVARRASFAWLGVVPFFVFSAAFLFLPVAFLVTGSFQATDGSLTVQNYLDLSDPYLVDAFRTSIEISAVTAIGGGIFGLLLAYSVILGGLPDILRSALMTFSGVASNFAGVPLALAFAFTLGNLGTVTRLIFGLTGFRITDGFSLGTKLGLEIVYLYFQFPLMVLIIAPALAGLRKDWREAAENLGASPLQYWRHVALPVLMPSILGAIVLLFGNAFGAQATAYQLTGGLINIVTLVITAQIRGDVLHNPGLGYAVAMGMVVIIGISILFYSMLQRRSERWLRG